MPDQSSPQIELLRAAYWAFNARDIDAALAIMAPDVVWPKAFKGGFVYGHQEVRAYWTEQWSEINPHVEPTSFFAERAGRVVVDVHQVVRDLAGNILADEHVGHRFTIEHDLTRNPKFEAAFNFSHSWSMTYAAKTQLRRSWTLIRQVSDADLDNSKVRSQLRSSGLIQSMEVCSLSP